MQPKNTKLVNEYLFMWKYANNIILAKGDVKGCMHADCFLKTQTHTKTSE